jgi:hypothetical protein
MALGLTTEFKGNLLLQVTRVLHKVYLKEVTYEIFADSEPLNRHSSRLNTGAPSDGSRRGKAPADLTAPRAAVPACFKLRNSVHKLPQLCVVVR